MADVNNYLLMHQGIRHESARLAGFAADLAAGRRHAGPRQLAALREHVAGAFAAIHHHHVAEDDFLWPLLAEAGVTELDELAAEHGLLDPLMARIGAALDTLTRDHRDAAAREEFAVAAVELHGLMEDHLTAEEAVVVPAVTGLVSVARFARMEKEMQQGSTAKVAFILPWLAEADPARMAVLLGHVGLPLRLALAASRRGYTGRLKTAYGVAATAHAPVVLRAEVQLFVPAGPARVYAVLSDVRRMAGYSPECYRAEWRDGASEPVVGATFQGWNRFKGMGWSRHCEIVTARPGQEFAFRTVRTATRPDTTLWRFRLQPVGDGTLVTQSYDLSAGRPVMFFERVSGRPASVPRAMRQTLERMAADLTREPGRAPAR